jgi:hypothetical protein
MVIHVLREACQCGGSYVHRLQIDGFVQVQLRRLSIQSIWLYSIREK